MSEVCDVAPPFQGCIFGAAQPLGPSLECGSLLPLSLRRSLLRRVRALANHSRPLLRHPEAKSAEGFLSAVPGIANPVTVRLCSAALSGSTFGAAQPIGASLECGSLLPLSLRRSLLRRFRALPPIARVLFCVVILRQSLPKDFSSPFLGSPIPSRSAFVAPPFQGSLRKPATPKLRKAQSVRQYCKLKCLFVQRDRTSSFAAVTRKERTIHVFKTRDFIANRGRL